MRRRRESIIGIVKKGHGIASGTAADSPYPAGSIAMQLPAFKAYGLDLYQFFPATLNISIYPYLFQMTAPRYTFRQVKWIENFPAEDFSFASCKVIYKEFNFRGYIYYPHPDTKERHFQDPYTLEVITHYIPGVKYGLPVQLIINQHEIKIYKDVCKCR